jgi:DNA-directed RNA polymerase specialized sigma24 family protein
MPPSHDPPDDFRSDDELARALPRGDARASAELVRRHGPRLRAFVFGDPRWAAHGEEIVRQTWALAEHGMRERKYRGGGFRGWLFKVAEQVAGRRTGGANPSRGTRLAKCLRRLRKARPEWHQLVIWISHGTSRTAVAKRMNLPKERLKKRYLRALAAVRACLTKHSPAVADDSGGGQ